MATLKEREDLEPLEPLSAAFINAEQEFIGAATVNFVVRVKPGAANVLEVPAGPGQDRAAVGIEGRWRWVEANVERADIGGLARTLDLYVTAAESDYDPGSPGEVDNTDRSFALALVEHNAAAPAGVDLTRKVAEAVWDGTKFTAVNPIVGGVVDTNTRPPNAHAASHRPGGSDELSHSVLAARAVLRPGVVDQVCAGRPLTVADFTTLLGLSAPVGLWNLGGLTDSSGNGRDLTNKGAVTFGRGITGAATEAAIFTGSTAQALYRSDAGAADPFRIRTGSWGCWFKTAKPGVEQHLISKWRGTGNQRSFILDIDASGQMRADVDVAGTGLAATTATVLMSDAVTDDTWHLGIATYDGCTLRLYFDGDLASADDVVGLIFAGTAPLNIGGSGADAGTAAANPHFGRVDEAFVTGDVLDGDQVRLLYAAKIAHGYSLAPSRADLTVRRRRRGAPLSSGDFPSAPLRLYNFTAGALTDGGSAGVDVAVGSTPVPVPDAAGAAGNAYALDGVDDYLGSTDAGLPSGTGGRSYGAWVNTATLAAMGIVGWGTSGTADARLRLSAAGQIVSSSGADAITGPVVATGAWAHVVAVEENAPADGVRRKLYVDGVLVGGSTTLTSLTLAGANRFRIGAYPDGTAFFKGAVDGVFVCDYALSREQIVALYAKGAQAMPPSPKSAGDHVEAITATDLYIVCDSLEPQHQVDLAVA